MTRGTFTPRCHYTKTRYQTLIKIRLTAHILTKYSKYFSPSKCYKIFPIKTQVTLRNQIKEKSRYPKYVWLLWHQIATVTLRETVRVRLQRGKEILEDFQSRRIRQQRASTTSSLSCHLTSFVLDHSISGRISQVTSLFVVGHHLFRAGQKKSQICWRCDFTYTYRKNHTLLIKE